MIKRRRSSSSGTESLQSFSVTGKRGVDRSKAPTQPDTLYDITNMDVNPDGSLSIRKPLLFAQDLTYDAMTPIFVKYLFDKKHKFVVYHRNEAGFDEYEGCIIDQNNKKFPITIVWYDTQGNKFSINPKYLGVDSEWAPAYVTITPESDGSTAFTTLLHGIYAEEPQLVNTVNTSIIGNCKVNLSLFSNGDSKIYDPILYDEASPIVPRYLMIARDEVLGWTLTVKTPALNYADDAGSSTEVGIDLTLDNPYAVRDAYTAGYVDVKKILLYANSKKVAGKWVPSTKGRFSSDVSTAMQEYNPHAVVSNVIPPDSNYWHCNTDGIIKLAFKMPASLIGTAATSISVGNITPKFKAYISYNYSPFLAVFNAGTFDISDVDANTGTSNLAYYEHDNPNILYAPEQVVQDSGKYYLKNGVGHFAKELLPTRQTIKIGDVYVFARPVTVNIAPATVSFANLTDGNITADSVCVFDVTMDIPDMSLDTVSAGARVEQEVLVNANNRYSEYSEDTYTDYALRVKSNTELNALTDATFAVQSVKAQHTATLRNRIQPDTYSTHGFAATINGFGNVETHNTEGGYLYFSHSVDTSAFTYTSGKFLFSNVKLDELDMRNYNCVLSYGEANLKRDSVNDVPYICADPSSPDTSSFIKFNPDTGFYAGHYGDSDAQNFVNAFVNSKNIWSMTIRRATGFEARTAFVSALLNTTDNVAPIYCLGEYKSGQPYLYASPQVIATDSLLRTTSSTYFVNKANNTIRESSVLGRMYALGDRVVQFTFTVNSVSTTYDLHLNLSNSDIRNVPHNYGNAYRYLYGKDFGVISRNGIDTNGNAITTREPVFGYSIWEKYTKYLVQYVLNADGTILDSADNDLGEYWD